MSGLIFHRIEASDRSLAPGLRSCDLLYGFLTVNHRLSENLRLHINDDECREKIRRSLQYRCFPCAHGLSVLARDRLNSLPCWLRKSGQRGDEVRKRGQIIGER